MKDIWVSLFDSEYIHFKKKNLSFQNFPIIQEFTNLRILTYNIWFDNYNAENRNSAIIFEILESNSNIVCLQECTLKFID